MGGVPSVGTIGESAIAEALLAHLGLRRYFDAVVAADHVQHHKPALLTPSYCARPADGRHADAVRGEDADYGLHRRRGRRNGCRGCPTIVVTDCRSCLCSFLSATLLRRF